MHDHYVCAVGPKQRAWLCLPDNLLAAEGLVPASPLHFLFSRLHKFIFLSLPSWNKCLKFNQMFDLSIVFKDFWSLLKAGTFFFLFFFLPMKKEIMVEKREQRIFSL